MLQGQQHRLEEERIKLRRGFRVSYRLLERVSQRLGLEAIKGMSFQEFERWCRKQGL